MNMWLAVDADGLELAFDKKPKRWNFARTWVPSRNGNIGNTLRAGSIFSVTKVKKTWRDEPVLIEDFDVDEYLLPYTNTEE